MRSSQTARAFGATLMAVALVFAAISGAVALAQTPVGDSIEDTTGVDTSGAEFIGQAEAVAPAVVGAVAVGAFVVGAGAGSALDNNEKTADELRDVDALETKVSIRGNTIDLKQKNDELHTVISNYLTDTGAVARELGRQAYIRELNNGSTESEATQASYNEIEDYYSGRKTNVVQSWKTTIASIRNMREVAQNTSNISESWPDEFALTNTNGGNNALEYVESADYSNNETVTLPNGTTVSVPTIRLTLNTSYGATRDTTTHTFSITDNTITVNKNDEPTDYRLDAIEQPAPSADYDRITALDMSKWRNNWDNIDSKTQTEKDRVQNFINATFDGYQAGDINSSELVSPTLAAEELSPENQTGAYTLRSLAAIGYELPDNFEGVASMNITNNGDNVTGILLSKDAPSGSFEVGTPYNTTNLDGTQYVVDSQTGELKTLDGEFNITSAESPNGTDLQTLDYQQRNYETTNITEYQELLQKNAELKAEIEARQQKLRDKLGGGGLFGGFSLFGLPGPMVLLLIGGAVYLLGRD